jgi:hypothetical protein
VVDVKVVAPHAGVEDVDVLPFRNLSRWMRPVGV